VKEYYFYTPEARPPQQVITKKFKHEMQEFLELSVTNRL
jgi:hypothetical protein